MKDWSSSSTLNQKYYSADEFKSLLEQTQGEYGGIGVELGWVENEHRIVNIVENSPAEDAGLEPQDTIVAVNQKPVQNLNTQQLHEILTGSVGTQVVLSVMRETFEKPWNFTLTRQWVRRPSFKVQELEPDILYVDIHLFSRGVGRALEKQILGPQAPKALILDLRDNPGGLFDEAVHVANLFLSKGTIVQAAGRGGAILETRDARPERTLFSTAHRPFNEHRQCIGGRNSRGCAPRPQASADFWLHKLRQRIRSKHHRSLRWFRFKNYGRPVHNTLGQKY